MPTTEGEVETVSKLQQASNEARNHFSNAINHKLRELVPAGIPENATAVQLQQAMLDEYLASKKELPKAPKTPAIETPQLPYSKKMKMEKSEEPKR